MGYQPFNKRKRWKDCTREACAHHEAGHVVASLEYGIPVISASIRPNKRRLGEIMHGPPPGSMQICRIEDLAVCLLAGFAAETRYNPTGTVGVDEPDLQRVAQMCVACTFGPDQACKLFEELKQRARKLVERRWEHVIRIAELLLEKNSVTGDQLRAALGTSIDDSQGCATGRHVLPGDLAAADGTSGASALAIFVASRHR